jgi:hypothetical protein
MRRHRKQQESEQGKLSEETWAVSWPFPEYVGWKWCAGQVSSVVGK